MPSLVILGASGFLGRSIISSENFPIPIKAIARKIPKDADTDQKGVTWIASGSVNKSSLTKILTPDDVVINLIFTEDANKVDNFFLIDNIVDACLEANVKRLVHCSTAVVVGASKARRVDELTSCEPITGYEKTKWDLEQRVLTATSKGLDVAILRPTAILGPGGKNLQKLATSLKDGSHVINYLRASCFGKRPMHLVPVRNVTAALLHLATLPSKLKGDVFIISSDDDVNNNFKSIEEVLLKSLGMKPRKLPLIPIPEFILSIMLRLLGRSDTNFKRIYDCTKLFGTNYKPVDSVLNAVIEFGEAYNKE